MDKIDLIIDTIYELMYSNSTAVAADKYLAALNAANELKALKPVAWVTQRTCDGGRVLDGFETCDFNDYGAIPVYALDEVTK
jgi:hypothetical protein